MTAATERRLSIRVQRMRAKGRERSRRLSFRRQVRSSCLGDVGVMKKDENICWGCYVDVFWGEKKKKKRR